MHAENHTRSSHTRSWHFLIGFITKYHFSLVRTLSFPCSWITCVLSLSIDFFSNKYIVWKFKSTETYTGLFPVAKDLINCTLKQQLLYLKCNPFTHNFPRLFQLLGMGLECIIILKSEALEHYFLGYLPVTQTKSFS